MAYQDDLPVLLGIGSTFEMYGKTFKIFRYELPDPVFEGDYDIVIISSEVDERIDTTQIIRDLKLESILTNRS